eukprot:jgi/Tetstr1/462973/TSEL_007920.t1
MGNMEADRYGPGPEIRSLRLPTASLKGYLVTQTDDDQSQAGQGEHLATIREEEHGQDEDEDEEEEEEEVEEEKEEEEGPNTVGARPPGQTSPATSAPSKHNLNCVRIFAREGKDSHTLPPLPYIDRLLDTT